MQNLGQEVCVLNMDSSACHFSTMVGIVAFLASIGFLVGEWYDSHFFLFHSLIFQKSREIAARQFSDCGVFSLNWIACRRMVRQFFSLIFKKSREIVARQFLFSKFWRFSVCRRMVRHFFIHSHFSKINISLIFKKSRQILTRQFFIFLIFINFSLVFTI